MFAIAGCLMLAAVGLWDSQQQHKPANYCEHTATGTSCRPQQYLSERAGLPATLERAISNPDPRTGQDHEKRDLAAQEASAVFAFWMAAISGFGLLVTVVGTILLYRQITLTREALEETGNATKAMQEANEIARDSAKRQLRPYVAFAPLIDGSEGEPVTLERLKEKPSRLELVNFGQTPARNVFVSSGSDVVTRPIGEANPAIEERHGVGDLAPGAKLPISFDFAALSDEDSLAVERGAKAMLLRFRVDYEIGDDKFDFEDVTMFLVKEHLGRTYQGHRLTDQARQKI